MGKQEIRPLATPKSLNRSSPNVAHVIRSHVQHLVTIPQCVSFPRIREIAHQKCLLVFLSFGFFQRPTAEALNRCSRKIRQTTRFCAQMCLFGLREQTLNISTLLIPEEKAIFGPDFDGPKTALQWGCSKKTPLNRHRIG